MKPNLQHKSSIVHDNEVADIIRQSINFNAPKYNKDDSDSNSSCSSSDCSSSSCCSSEEDYAEQFLKIDDTEQTEVDDTKQEIQKLIRNYIQNVVKNRVPKLSEMKKEDREENFSSILSFALAKCPFDF